MGRASVLCIDGSNLFSGGAENHIVNLLANVEPRSHGVDRVEIWARQRMLSLLPDRPWLFKHKSWLLEGSLAARTAWRQTVFPGKTRSSQASLVFSPGGLIPKTLKVPSVAMVRNSLPFTPREARRYPLWSWQRTRNTLLRQAIVRSIRRASGVIFLSEHAKRIVEHVTPVKDSIIIPHGIEERFRSQGQEISASAQPASDTFRVLCVSAIDVYKNQTAVAQAAIMLRDEGFQLSVTFVGPVNYRPEKRRLDIIANAEPELLHIIGQVPFSELHRVYHEYDAFIFPSTCENHPNTLVEAMASGLPIICSDEEPMRSIAGDSALQCEMRDPESIAGAVRSMICSDPGARRRLSEGARTRSQEYSWERTSHATFAFLAQVLERMS